VSPAMGGSHQAPYPSQLFESPVGSSQMPYHSPGASVAHGSHAAATQPQALRFPVVFGQQAASPFMQQQQGSTAPPPGLAHVAPSAYQVR
jgi:hypothetical protein